MEPETILVIAGNYNQYKAFLRDNNLDRTGTYYVSRPDQLMGMRKCKYALTGEYWLNPLIDKGEQETMARLRAYEIEQWNPPTTKE